MKTPRKWCPCRISYKIAFSHQKSWFQLQVLVTMVAKHPLTYLESSFLVSHAKKPGICIDPSQVLWFIIIFINENWPQAEIKGKRDQRGWGFAGIVSCSLGLVKINGVLACSAIWAITGECCSFGEHAWSPQIIQHSNIACTEKLWRAYWWVVAVLKRSKRSSRPRASGC